MNALRQGPLRSAALLAFALLGLIALVPEAPLAAQEHPNVARGFSRDKAFQVGDVDHINLFNGNLVLTLPLGQSFPVGGGLSFGLTLTYNSNAWDFEERFAPSQNSYTQALPGLRFNAGLGWLLTLGQLNPPRTSVSPEGHEVYLGPDGAEHALYDTLHEGEAAAKAVQHTRDGSYLRLRGVPGAPREIDFPDGTIHRFDATNRLIQIRSRFLKPDSTPADTVDITYTANDWTIKTTVDGHVRTQTVHFRTGMGSYSKLVDYVELATWNNPSPPARYTFNYSLVTVQRPCPHNDQTEGGLPLAAAVPLLVSLTRPDGSQFSMPASDYVTNLGGSTCANPWNGAIKRVTLPTFGRLEWDYQIYAFPIDSSSRPFRQRSAGVAQRRLRISPTDPSPYVWTYTTAITPPVPSGSPAEELVNTVIDPLNNKIENYFAIFARSTVATNGTSPFEYGLPISHLTQDGSGRLLSTRTFNSSLQLIRSTYAKYDFDPSSTIPVLEERSRLNQRISQNETVYHDDPVVPGMACTGIGTAKPCRIATVVSSDFDGLGHYRTTTTGGNFGNADTRTAFTNYNPGRGTYPGSFVPPAAADPWVLETFDRMTESEGGFTSRVDACFDSATGFLKRKRVYKTGTSPSTEDVVSVMTPDVQGNVAIEESYGGDNAGLDTVAPLCSMNPGTSRYRAVHTYQFGVRTTSQATNAAGGIPAAINFKWLDLTIDPSTGLPTESRDSVGWRTTYKYDALGRVTEIKPLAGPVAGPVGAWTRYTYNRATSGSNPATVDSQSCASTSSTCTTPLEQSQLVFDYLGRLTKERHKMPNGTWSKQVTTYNGNGWKDFVSEMQADSTNDGALTGTKYRNYDPFGRPGLLIPADGTAHQVTLAYEGVRKTLRTAKVATSYNQASGTANETFATTTEISDRQGRLAQVIEPNSISTFYNYDVGQRLRRVCQNSNATGSTCGQERLFTYDNRGFLTTERHPEKGGATGNGTVTYSLYDPRGHVGRKQDGPANLTFTYDLAERLTDVSETATGRPLKKFTFGIGTSDKGKLAKAERWNYRFLGGSENTALIAETYQHLGRDGKPSQRDTTLTFAGVANEHFVQTFGYHELGMLEAQSYPNCTGFAACSSSARTVSNVFTEGRVTAVSGYTGTAPGQTAGIGITHHPNGQIHQVAHVNSVVATYGLDPFNLSRPASINASKAGTTLWDTGTYKYDGSGNIWKIGSSWFEYDSLSRLITGAVFPNPLGGGTQQKQSSAFDVYGNLQSLTTQIGIASATTRPTPTSSATNRLASPSTYDSAGALTNWNGAFYEYDGLNQLARYGSGTEDWFYTYTADDERVWSFKPALGATPRFDRWTLRGLDGQVLREYPISGYVWDNWEDNIYRDGQLLANYLSGGQRRNFDLDHLGTPRLITNLAGSVTSYHVYYPFGEEATSSTQDTERLKFTGHERDLNSQAGATPSADDLDYMHARFCSPVTGRFLSVDTADGSQSSPQSWNRYAYVLGNPVKYSDPLGLAEVDTCMISADDSTCSGSITVTAPDPRRGSTNNPRTGERGLNDLVSARSTRNGDGITREEFAHQVISRVAALTDFEGAANSTASEIPIDGADYGSCVRKNRADPAAALIALGSGVPKRLVPPFRVPDPASPLTTPARVIGHQLRGAAPGAARALRAGGRALSKIATPLTIAEGLYDLGVIAECAF